MRSGILNMAVSIVFIEMIIGERLRITMWWRKQNTANNKIESESSKIVSYSCLKCKCQIKVPKDYIDQFRPGGREYHLDGQSYLHCPECGEMIEIK